MNNLLKKNKKNDSGMMVVEAVISFTAFLMVCFGIVFMINIFMLHNRVQFALNSAAREISSYGYLYDALGLRSANEQLDKDAEGYTKPIDDTVTHVADTLDKMQETLDAINGTVSSAENIEMSEAYYHQMTGQLEHLKTSVGGTVDSGKQALADLKALFSDPKALLVGMIYIGADAADYQIKRLVGMGAGAALTPKYLKTKNQDGDAYLKACGVIDGLDFSSSTVFADEDNRMIDLVAEYDIDLSFLNYVLPHMKIHVVQRASIGSWAGGDGAVVPK